MELSLKGFKDLLPAEMIARDKIVAIIKSVFESYGFVPIATPALEFKRVLLAYSDLTAEFTKDEFDSFLAEYPQTRKTLQPFVRENRSIVSVRISDLSIKTQNELGEEAYERIIDQTVPDKQIYTFREPEGKAVGLKFDLTVPMSRFVAEHKELPRPFKRYQFQPVWRFDKPDPGRFREFAQFDIDTVGTKDMAADAEIIAAMNDSLAKLGVNYRIRFSTRKALNSLLKYAGINEAASHAVFKIIDKLKKQGIESVEQELGHGRSDASGDEIKGLGLEADQIRRIRGFLEISQPTRSETIVTLEKFFANVAGAGEGITELIEIHKHLEALGISDDRTAVDLSIARGLDYYTGPVFEAVLTDERLENFGSIMGGGRYDRLIGKFLGEDVPATGASIGVDRLLSAMRKIGAISSKPSTADVLVTVMDRERMIDYQRIAMQLRITGIRTELYMGEEKSLGKQLKYADNQMIPIAVIAGSNEFTQGQVSIKDLRAVNANEVLIKSREEWIGKKLGQVTVSRNDLVTEIRKRLDS